MTRPFQAVFLIASPGDLVSDRFSHLRVSSFLVLLVLLSFPYTGTSLAFCWSLLLLVVIFATIYD